MAKSEVRVNDECIEIAVHRGVRQGDTISPKLFSTALEHIFQRLPWDKRGLKINGHYLSNLHFADGIILVPNTAEELQRMTTELNKEARKIGLKINTK